MPRCPEIVEGRVYCPEHSAGWSKWQAANPGKSDGYGSQWRRARAAALDRAGHRCEVCGTTEGPLEVHHRDHRSPLEPGANQPSNLIVVCVRDHRRLEREHRRRPKTK